MLTHSMAIRPPNDLYTSLISKIPMTLIALYRIKNRNILALSKLLLAFTQGQIVTLGETHEHGAVFSLLMPSNRGPQRAASNSAHEQLVIVF